MSSGCFVNGLLPDIQLQVQAQIRMRKHLGELDMNFFDLQQLTHNIKEQQELDEQRSEKNKKMPLIKSVYAAEEESDDTDDDEEVKVYYAEELRNRKNRRMNASHVATVARRPQKNLIHTSSIKSPQRPMPEYVQVIEQCPDEDAVYVYYATEEDRPHRKKISSSDLNTGPNECWKCGLQGHFAFGESRKACPMRNYDLELELCPQCKKGGHKPENCLRSYSFDKGN